MTSDLASSSSKELEGVRRVGVVGQNVHAEASQAPAQGPSHRAQPDQADRPAVQFPGPVTLVGDLPVPVDLALSHVAVGRDHAARGGEQEGHSELGHGVGVAPRCAQDRDPGSGGRRHVDVGGITAAAGHGQDRLLVEVGAAHVTLDNHDVGAFGRRPLGELVGVVDAEGGLVQPGIEHQIRQFVQQVEAGTAHRGRHQSLRAGTCHVGRTLLVGRTSSIMTDHDMRVRFMKSSGSAVTVGVDVGTTSVKALAVDAHGRVVARSRVPHNIVAPEPDVLRHDAKKAWRAGPRKAFELVTAQLHKDGSTLAGVAVASMVPSMTAVNRRGVPVLPGLLYGDREGRAPSGTPDDAVRVPGTMPDAEGFLRWASTEVPDARGYWPCQAVATNAISGLPAVDTGVTASLGMLHTHKGWNNELLTSMGVSEAQMPMVVPMGQAGGHAATQRRRDHGRHHRRALRPDRVGGDPAGRRPGDFWGDADLLGGVRRMARGGRADQLSEHDCGPVPHRRTEQCRRPLRRLGPPAAPRHAAPRPGP